MNPGRGRQRRRRGGPRNTTASEARAGQESARRNTRGSGRSRANAKNNSNNGGGGDSSANKKPVPVVDEEAAARAAEEEALKRKQDEEARIEAERLEKERKEAERIENERKAAEKAAAAEKEREFMAQRAAELLEKRRLLRIANAQYIGDPPEKGRITEAELRKLDSSVKKCTAFIRKLRGTGINEDSHKSLLADVRLLNLSRYISEVVTAISECRLRSSDCDYAVVVASELHQRFEEFAGQLSNALSTVVLCTHPNASKDLPNRRGAMRLLVEVYVLSMHNDVSAVTSVLKELMKAGRESKEIAVANLSVIASFVRSVSRALLAPPATADITDGGKEEEERESTWEDDVAPANTKQIISSALESYYKSEAIKLYEETKEDLREAEMSTLRARQTKGSVDDACQAKHYSAKSTFERIFAACTTLADALGLSAPNPITRESDADANKTADNGGVYAVFHGKGTGGRGTRGDGLDIENSESESLFESEEDRAFYNDLPDTAKTPDTTTQTQTPQVPKAPKEPKDYSKADGGTGAGAAESSNENSETKAAVGGTTSETSSTSALKTKAEAPKETEKEKSSGRSSRKKGEKNPSLDHLLARLGATETRENADRFTYQFISAAESSRKPTQRLAKSLIAVSPQKLNVLPAYSRIAASLRPVYPDVALSVSETLEKEFRIFAERTDLDDKTLSSCIKTARYVGEYCKFRMMDYETVFSLLNFCIKDLDFTGHRVDMACHLLESCGRMIYRTPSSSIRMGNLLDTVWRLKSVKNLEPRHNTLVETAFHAARPASGVKLQRRKNRPPMKEYIRRLIYGWLTPETVRFTALQMKRLPWDEEIQSYVIKKFIKVNRMKFSNIPYVAVLISAVGKYRKEVLVGVVDGILEAIRAGMERNDGRDAQRRVSEVALLGELFNSHVLSEKVIFFVLYQFITLGHEAPGNSHVGADASATALLNSEPSGNNTDANESLDLTVDVQSRKMASTGFFLAAPDPPRDYFRIRLVCTLIETCGQNLLREKRRKVRVFWTLFERYAYCKAVQSGLDGQLPLHIDHILSDAFEKMNRREAYATDGRKPLVEGNSRMRVRTKESERKRMGALKEAENSDDKWERALSLEVALRKAQEAESNPVDLSLISLPVRSINLSSSKTNAKDDANSVGETNKGLNKNEVLSNGTKLMRGENGSDTSPDGEDDISLDTEADVLEEVVDEDDDDVEGNEMLEAAEEVDENDDGSDGGSMNSDSEGDDDEDSENSGDDEDDEDEDDEEDEIVVEKKPKSEEEEMFERELAAFTAAERQTARESTSRVATLNRMAIPMGLMAQKRAEERAAAAAAAEQHGEDGNGVRVMERGRKNKRIMEPRVEFKFLVRKGGKSAIQDLSVPATSSLAVAARESESVGAAAQEEKKRLVLASSIVVNGDDDDGLEQFVPLRTQQDARQKEQSIKEQRTADEAALLATLFSGRKKR